MAEKVQVQTEATAKKVKAVQALAMLAVVIGAACLVAGIPLENDGLIVFGMWSLFLGAPLAVVMRVVRWWLHG